MKSLQRIPHSSVEGGGCAVETQHGIGDGSTSSREASGSGRIVEKAISIFALRAKGCIHWFSYPHQVSSHVVISTT